MAQIITPAPADKNEQAAKNWQTAQRVRQIMQQIQQLDDDFSMDSTTYVSRVWAQSHFSVAIQHLREVFNALVPEEQRMGTPKAKRRSGV